MTTRNDPYTPTPSPFAPDPAELAAWTAANATARAAYHADLCPMCGVAVTRLNSVGRAMHVTACGKRTR